MTTANSCMATAGRPLAKGKQDHEIGRDRASPNEPDVLPLLPVSCQDSDAVVPQDIGGKQGSSYREHAGNVEDRMDMMHGQFVNNGIGNDAYANAEGVDIGPQGAVALTSARHHGTQAYSHNPQHTSRREGFV